MTGIEQANASKQVLDASVIKRLAYFNNLENTFSFVKKNVRRGWGFRRRTYIQIFISL